MNNVEKTFRIIGICLVAILLSFGGGYIAGRLANSGKSTANIIDTSGVDRITELARSGLIAERQDIERQRANIIDERKRLADERAINQRERERAVTERQGYADIERLVKSTIRIVEERTGKASTN